MRLPRIPRTPLLLGVIALGLYLPGFWWGAPHATAPDRVQSWGVDDGTPLQPLADVHNILQPKPDRNFGYPLMHSFVLTAAYSPYLGWLYLTGQFTPANAVTYPYGLADPVGALRTLTLIGRLVSVLMGVGIVIAAWAAARELWGERTGAVAGLAVMSLYPLFYYSRVGNPDGPSLFYASIALAVLARSMRAGFTVRRGIWLGAFVGFAVATKESIAALFLALPFVLLCLIWPELRRTGWLAWSAWKPVMLAALATFVAFGAGSGLFVDPKFYLRHLEFGRERVQTLAEANIAHVRSYPHTWEGHVELTRALGSYLADCMTPAGLMLGLVGLVWVSRREPRAAWLALPVLTYVAPLFWVVRAGQLRYLLPAALVLAFFAARALVLAWEWRQPAARWAMTAVGALAIGLGLLRGADLTHAMIRDSRFAAADWLVAHAGAGAKVEFFGESGLLPPLSAAVQTTRSIAYRGAVYKHQTGPAAIAEILDGWRARQPDLIILVPDHSSPPGVPYNATCPPEIFRGLMEGAYGYELAARFETPALLPWVRRPRLDYPSVNPPIHIFARAAAPLEGGR